MNEIDYQREAGRYAVYFDIATSHSCYFALQNTFHEMGLEAELPSLDDFFSNRNGCKWGSYLAFGSMQISMPFGEHPIYLPLLQAKLEECLEEQCANNPEFCAKKIIVSDFFWNLDTMSFHFQCFLSDEDESYYYNSDSEEYFNYRRELYNDMVLDYEERLAADEQEPLAVPVD